ncbi:MAG: hypothetical protein CVV29_11365 [Methanobacteriales archaeon HGW-Methanobacteriales-2]|nr:MAG: hypothetical protein CVV29_11365 [Methanobacteriales archaeon HGW-Methanobacteriales-2]
MLERCDTELNFFHSYHKRRQKPHRVIARSQRQQAVGTRRIDNLMRIYLDPNARHFGMAIEESIIEK